jgi:hypothetical protein
MSHFAKLKGSNPDVLGKLVESEYLSGSLSPLAGFGVAILQKFLLKISSIKYFVASVVVIRW